VQKCKRQVAERLARAAAATWRQAPLARNAEWGLAGERTKAVRLFPGERPTSQLAALPPV